MNTKNRIFARTIVFLVVIFLIWAPFLTLPFLHGENTNHMHEHQCSPDCIGFAQPVLMTALVAFFMFGKKILNR